MTPKKIIDLPLLESLPGYAQGKPLPPPQPMGAHAKKSAAAIREAMFPGGQAKPEQAFLPFAPMPTELCRVSPFFPMSRNETANRPYIADMVITKSSWGELRYTGEKLSIYEEDALLAVMAVLDSTRGDHETYVYEGPALPILRLMGYEKPNKTEYERLETAFRRMAGATFHLRIKGVMRTTENIISKVAVDEKTRHFVIALNPYFAEQYIAGSVTLLDVVERRKLKRATAKSLYRFISSHRNGTWQGHFMTLAATMNLNLDQPQFELRRQIKDAVAELRKSGMLARSSGFTHGSKDVVRLVRPGAGQPALKK
ncbi:replication initiation protein [Desulfolutivibrio sulfoxidireducens]|uniref:replication initiation protein n=1 Tax=Desulfolutivibrio sulfoxidireducens TaxID=2773299 RepID=UPI00159E26F9|nr:replication initiation protein [Desulfolutivibrio sulfoxidireducens]QLA18202.1 hypothetical protein GD605_18745 [Desulfolutivibrio sulfoxidireducens]